MTLQNTFLVSLMMAALLACDETVKSDAHGNFEATSITVSAKGNGELVYLNVDEGQRIAANQIVGVVDTTHLHLEKRKLQAQLKSLEDKLRDAGPEIAVLNERLANLTREKKRTELLLKQKAATQKQLDDLNGEIDVTNRQISSAQREIAIANRGIMSEREPMLAQLAILQNSIQDHLVVNPLSGTVLTKLSESSELVGLGTPLYKVADLETLKLRAYTSASLLTQVSLGDEVKVLVDDGKEGYRELTGTIAWISEEAEFTPKTIETKEERVNLVYALEVKVKNDGSLKIGMPGEVIFNKQQSL
ncbi:MAG: HlyD family efflux transporter periplasmic adaptor subunit [Cyclobacteriaceae bacterium]